jgi:hypothetical protein
MPLMVKSNTAEPVQKPHTFGTACSIRIKSALGGWLA